VFGRAPGRRLGSSRASPRCGVNGHVKALWPSDLLVRAYWLVTARGAPRSTSCARNGLAAPGSLQPGAALRAVPLGRPPALDHLVARGALEHRRLEPPARAGGAGERDLARRSSPPMQHTAGPGPPEPSCGADHGHPLGLGPGRRGPHPGARRCLPPMGFAGWARTPPGPPGAWCGPASPAAAPLPPALPPGDDRPAPAPGAVRTRDTYTPGVDQGRGGPYRQDRIAKGPLGADPGDGGSRRRARERSWWAGAESNRHSRRRGFTVPAPASVGVRRVGFHARSRRLLRSGVRRRPPRLLPALLPGEAARAAPRRSSPRS